MTYFSIIGVTRSAKSVKQVSTNGSSAYLQLDAKKEPWHVWLDYRIWTAYMSGVFLILTSGSRKARYDLDITYSNTIILGSMTTFPTPQSLIKPRAKRR